MTITLEDFQRLAIAAASYGLPVQIGLEAPENYYPALAHYLLQQSSVTRVTYQLASFLLKIGLIRQIIEKRPIRSRGK